MSAPRAGQLPLALGVLPHARLETYVAGRNAAAVRHVTELAAGRNELLWLWGPAGSGKTHLLQAACSAADRSGKRAMYLALGSTDAIAPAILGGLDAIDVLALDGIDTVAGVAAWESALFTLLNARLGGHGALLMAARRAPAAAGFALADLGSRAAAGAVYRLEPLDDAAQIAALTAHARVRGLELDPAAAEYLQHRVARDMAELVRWLDRLDRASLAAQRKLTIPFIRDRLLDGGSA